MTNEEFIKLVKTCTKIKELQIEYQCYGRSEAVLGLVTALSIIYFNFPKVEEAILSREVGDEDDE